MQDYCICFCTKWFNISRIDFKAKFIFTPFFPINIICVKALIFPRNRFINEKIIKLDRKIHLSVRKKINM